APLSAGGEPGHGGEERADARPRQDLRRLARVAAHAARERPRHRPRGAQAASQTARRARVEPEREALMLVLWLLYAVGFTAIVAGAALALEQLATIWDVPRRVVWIAALTVAVIAPVILA